MKFAPRLLPALAALAVLAPAPAAFAQGAPTVSLGAPASAAKVSASLKADRATVAPGESFTLALVLDHAAHWHTYWKNPGDAGSLTSIEWQESSGATFGAWRHPAPVLYKQEGIANFVYEGRSVILIPVTVPATLKPGDTLKLKGRADWLECDDSSCHPNGADVALEIPVAAAGTAANAELFAAAAAAIPADAPAGAAALSNGAGNAVTLRVAGSALAGVDAATAKFFPASDALPAALSAAKPVVGADGVLSFTFADAAKVRELNKLDGVITFAKGRALAVSAAFGELAAAAAPGAPKVAPAATTPAAPTGETQHELPMLLLLGFLGGMLLNIMPCVFPVLGLKIYGFVNKAHADRRKVVAHALAFAAGILVSFWALAAVIVALKSGAITLLGASGTDIGWGFLLQIPGFVAGIAVLFLVMGLSMAGLFEFGTSVQNAAGSVEDRQGYAGSFLSGVLATLVATPCSGPGLAPALAAAFARPAPEAFAIFTAIALGLALPFVALAASPKLMSKLPRPGAWMESFKQAMAFLMFGTLAYFVWILGAQTEGLAFLTVLFALVGIAVSCWIYGRWCAPHRSTGVRRAGMALAALFFLGSAYALNGALPERENTADAAVAKEPDIVWEAWTPEVEAKHLAAGSTVYIDFTARWCATCQVNKRVFHDAAVIKAFAAGKVVALKADWTKRDAVIAAELKKYNRSAIPFNVVLRQGAAPRPLPEVLTSGAVLDALKAE